MKRLKVSILDVNDMMKLTVLILFCCVWKTE